MKPALLLAAASVLAACGEPNYTQYVDPLIGSGAHGHVFVGANVPFGLVQLGPSNIKQDWDWCSGYHYSDSTIIGFSHMHLSGTGIGDLGDINLMPATGSAVLARGNASEGYASGQYSLFRRKTETAKAGYYAVHLDRYDIDVELTATQRVGFHKYTFRRADSARIIIDLVNGQAWDRATEGYLEQQGDSAIVGYRYSKGWANDQKVYFAAKFSKPIKRLETIAVKYDRSALPPLRYDSASQGSMRDTRVYGQAFFDIEEDETIYVKVALSPTSIENAALNMAAEMPHWNFILAVNDACDAWNKELGKIDITADTRTKRIFYTALYHTMIAPSVFCDVNGGYRGSDGRMHKGGGFVNYTTFSLWDTYRAAHPLMTLIHREKVNDIVNTMLAIFRQQGKLPVWHLMGCETDCMVGNPGVSVVADAILKGFDGFDKEAAFEAMKRSAMLDERGMQYLKEYGYIPYDKEPEGLAKCMEYAIADWAIAQVAKQLGKQEDYDYFLNRSKAYHRYYDKASGFMRGLSADGKFREPFNPFESVHRDNDYTEGNAWQYTWLVPQDVLGLADLMGKERFIAKLDSLFVVEGSLGENASPDISGLIGQYAHGNEPSHHVIYMYAYLGQQGKMAQRARQVMRTMYNDAPDGLSGNEDVGQMSAWYVLSALGLYQVEPAGGRFVIGSPIVDKAVIKMDDGKTFTITAKNHHSDSEYNRTITLNGKPYEKFYLDYAEVAGGGKMEIGEK